MDFYLDLVHLHMKNVDHHENIIVVHDHDHVQKRKVNVNVVHHQVDHRLQKKSKKIIIQNSLISLISFYRRSPRQRR
jgi:hypothetical protein